MKQYASIDLKSFYASVECIERGLNPLEANLVVADDSRTEKTICLAISPSLKEYGIGGRPRLFEVVQKVKEINAKRKYNSGIKEFEGKSFLKKDLNENAKLELEYIIAKPRMAYYINYSSRIYNIYLKYFSHEDIHVYSIDEVFIDLTNYLRTYNMSSREIIKLVLKNILKETGITATAGIGTNLYLSKIAMDILAKHTEPDSDGVRIAELDEMKYKENLWDYRPLTSFWRVGKGYAKKLEKYGLYTMGDIARCSLGIDPYYNENLLFKLFGKNAELLIDHAWGYESVAINDIKSYSPSNNCLTSGQVLKEPYNAKKARLVTWEMADLLTLDIVSKGLVTDQIVLTIGYDRVSLENENIRKNYKGEITKDAYGREIPKHTHGTINLKNHSSSSSEILKKTMELYDKIINDDLLIRRITIVFNHIILESEKKEKSEQINLFENYGEIQKKNEYLEKEKRLQDAIIKIRTKYGKNAIIKAKNLEDGATAIERNNQIGGHRA